MVKKGALRSCRLLQPLLLLPPRAGASLASPLADGLSPSPLLRGKRAFGRSRFSILQAWRLDGSGKPVKCPSQVVEAPRGAPSLRRRPWPRQNALNLPQQPRSQHLVVPQDARAVSSRPAPRWGLRPPARAPAAGTLTRSPFASTRPRAPFATPLPPSAAEREPRGRTGTRPDAPNGQGQGPRGHPTPRARQGQRGARGPRDGHVTRLAPPHTPRRPRDDAILAQLSVTGRVLSVTPRVRSVGGAEAPCLAAVAQPAAPSRLRFLYYCPYCSFSSSAGAS